MKVFGIVFAIIASIAVMTRGIYAEPPPFEADDAAYPPSE